VSTELINVELFIKEYEKEHINFKAGTPTLTSQSKVNLRKIISAINFFYGSSQEYKPNIYKLSYMLATIRHETYHFPTAEFFSEKPEVGDVDYFDKYDPVLANSEERKARARNNGNTQQGNGYKYRGRGCVHLTWKKITKEQKINSTWILLVTQRWRLILTMRLLLWFGGWKKACFQGGVYQSLLTLVGWII
jgi:hypothetical protein